MKPGPGVFVLLTLLATAGCSGENDDSAKNSPGASVATTNGSAKLEACALVTQDDASRLFGKPASRYAGTPVLDPNLIGECLWSWDSETSSHLLQFRVWNGQQYYAAMPESKPVDFAETGFIRSHPMAGVDVGWVRNGKTVSLSYSTVGPDAPKAETRVEQVRELAAAVNSKL